MTQSKAGWYGFAVAGLAVAIVTALVFQWLGRDVRFCRNALSELAHGRPGAQKHLAWDRLQVLGQDVGGFYRQLPNDVERQQYRMAFVNRFAAGFQQAQAKAEDFDRWRIAERQAGGVVIAATHRKRGDTLLFLVSSRPHRIEGLQWQ